MPITTVTLSSVGTSPPISCNWRGGKPATVVAVAGTSTSSADFIVQFTLDDAQIANSSSPTWFGFSSNSFSIENAAAIHYSASSAFPGSSGVPECVFIPLNGPVAGLRLSSTSMASGASVQLKLLSGEGW
jgi:hypothetical protein